MDTTTTATVDPSVQAALMPQFLVAQVGTAVDDNGESTGEPRYAQINAALSKHGNVYYSFSAQGVVMPEGFAAKVAVRVGDEEIVVPLDKFGHAKQSGNEKVDGTADVVIAGVAYKAQVTLSKAKLGTFVKIAVTKKPQPGERKPVIKGGAFIS